MKKLLIILFLSTISCFAKEETLKVGVAMGLPPMAYMEKGEIKGVEIDLLNEYAKSTNTKYELVNLNFEDLIPALEKGKIDVIMATMSHTPDRAKRADFTQAYAIISQMPLVHKKDSMKYQDTLMLINTIDDVCVIKDYTAEELVKNNFKYAKHSVVDSTSKALERLLKGESQVFIADSVLIMWLAQNYKDEGLLALPLIIRKENVCWAVKKGNNELLGKLNNFIETLKKENKLDNIIRQKIPYYDSKLYNRN